MKVRHALGFSVYFLMVGYPLSGFSQSSLDENSFREIYPIPRIGKYQRTVIPIPSKITLTTDALFSREKVQMAATDVSEYITRRYGKTFTVEAGNDKNQKAGFGIVILSPKNIPAELKSKLFTSPFLPEKFPPGLRGEQSFIIRSFLADKEPVVYLVSPTWQGAYYALFAAVQLIRFENGSFIFRGADVIDWPAFEARVTSDLCGLSETMPVETQRALIIRKAAIQRTTHGVYGYSKYTNQAAYALVRGLRLGIGYWERPTLKPPLKSFNWSDPASIKGYADIAGSYAGIPGMGLYVWHDGTDAGWWHEYLDDFWAQRDEVDKKNYPTDPTPARADAVRFEAMMNAIRKANPDTHVFLTLPCYYDVPENDKLPRVELLRDYLRTVGSAIPKDMKDHFYFILEEKSPESTVAYSKYLGTKVSNYRYTPLWNGGTWDLNYTEAKRHDGKTPAYYYDIAFLHLDLINLLAGQYLWNPDLPTDEKWIINNLAPRAAYLAYGPAWKEMVQFFTLNLNHQAMSRESDVKNLKQYRYTVEKTERWVTKAAAEVLPGWVDAQEVVRACQRHVAEAKTIVAKGLELTRKEVPLAKANITVSSSTDNRLTRPGAEKGRWDTSAKTLPQSMEIELPQPYLLTRLLIGVPNTGGYTLIDMEIQALINDAWKTVGHTNSREQATAAVDFTDVQTDRLKLIVHRVWDWSKQPRFDVHITSLQLFGRPLPKDPKGTLRLTGRWMFRLDPGKEGIKKEWFKQTTFAADWAQVTVPARQEEYPVSGAAGYDGWSWFTRPFEVPRTWKGHVIKLKFEAVDDEAEVWLNGNRIGEHRKEGPNDPNWWEEPFEFDITANIRWDQPNTVVVLVNDFTLDGGIYKPVFLHWADGPGILAPQDK